MSSESGAGVVRTFSRGRVEVIVLDVPDRLNAFTDEMETGLLQALEECDADPGVGAVVITGAGRAFCAGMDLGESTAETLFRDWRTSATAPAGSAAGTAPDGIARRRDGGGRVALRIYAMAKPVVAAINGDAVGVGITMTLPCDARVMASGARAGFVFVHRGLVPEACSSWFLPRLVGIPTALDWIYSGRLVTADAALEARLVDEVVDPGDVLDAAVTRAERFISRSAPVSLAVARRLVWDMAGAASPWEAHRVETEALNILGVAPDAVEGVASFLERRAPRFRGQVPGDVPSAFYADIDRPFEPVTGSDPGGRQ